MWKLCILSCLFLFVICECKKATTTDNPVVTPSGKGKGKGASDSDAGAGGGDTEDPDAECGKKKKCKDRNQICSNGFCVCKQGFTSNPDGTKCIKVPGFGEKCDADKNNILYCQGVGVSPICPDNGKCECEKGYEAKGKACVFKDQNLNEQCKGDEDCGVAYSSCQGGKCSCLSGFKTDKGLCVADAKCPSGDVLKDGDKPKACERKGNKDAGEEFEDDGNTKDDEDTGCPSTHFCFPNPLLKTKTGTNPGVCCPAAKGNVKAICPAGQAKAIKQCSPDVTDDGDFKDTNFDDKSTDLCPALSHNCVEINDTNLCCPTPCPGHLTFFAFEGRCYEALAPGSLCKFDVQCGRRATCSDKDKKCVCKDNYTETQGACERNDQSQPNTFRRK